MVFIEVLRFGGEVLEVQRFEGSRERGKERFEGIEFEVRRFVKVVFEGEVRRGVSTGSKVVKVVFEEGEVRRGKERCSTGSRR